jgi:hypothetical protein
LDISYRSLFLNKNSIKTLQTKYIYTIQKNIWDETALSWDEQGVLSVLFPKWKGNDMN